MNRAFSPFWLILNKRFWLALQNWCCACTAHSLFEVFIKLFFFSFFESDRVRIKQEQRYDSPQRQARQLYTLRFDRLIGTKVLVPCYSCCGMIEFPEFIFVGDLLGIYINRYFQ